MLFKYHSQNYLFDCYRYKAGTSGIKPPDLWIHHDQMELKNVEKNQDSVGGGGSGGSLPRESSSLAEKHHPQYMSKYLSFIDIDPFSRLYCVYILGWKN